jgi:hypothetical protein
MEALVLAAVLPALVLTLVGQIFRAPTPIVPDSPKLLFCCGEDNDLYRGVTAGGESYTRVNSPEEAIARATSGWGVLILADGYPEATTKLDQAFFDGASKKGLRLFVEYPSSLPGLEVKAPRRTHLERAVVASEVFGPSLPKLRLLALHDCHFVEVEAPEAHLVAARVAGFDTAVFGLSDVKAHPLLLEHPDRELLISTTKLSQFVTARYATQDAMQTVWRMVFEWLQPGTESPELRWTPSVRPTYARDDPLPADAARRAIIRGVDWHTNARMLIHTSWKDKYDEYRRQGIVDPRDPTGPLPDPEWPAGDGRFGVLEGVSSRINHDGTQPVRWWLRTDSNGESALAFALRSRLDGDRRSRRVAANLLDWVYFDSRLFQNDATEANLGLVHWAGDSSSLYGDNDIRIILGCIGTAALLETDRWDEVLLRNILGNYRTTGIHGFRGGALNDGQLLKLGWQHYWRGRTIHYAPHYEAWIWAAYLWLYDKTGYQPLLERTRNAIGMMMEAYPERWKWTNGIQQERGRMLLPLAWLIRVDDRPEHRAWLKRIADDLREDQDVCGAIREELGELSLGGYRPPLTNAEYGTREASLIQSNGDPVADLLYTCNFAFLGLHEAHAATGDEQLLAMADRLAEFLIRIQIRSEAHPELDGGWFRAFDFRHWDYWGSNADSGWGAWSIEVGWTQAWIPTVLALRELDLNLWDLSRDSEIAERWKETRALMLPEDQIELPELVKIEHAAVGKIVVLVDSPDPRYSGRGAASLTDGQLELADHMSPGWLGFLGGDLVATIDLESPTELHELGVDVLQSTRVGVMLPRRVEFAVSDDGSEFRILGELSPKAATGHTSPQTKTLKIDVSGERARYIRAKVVNAGRLPEWIGEGATEGWLFVGELIVR